MSIEPLIALALFGVILPAQEFLIRKSHLASATRPMGRPLSHETPLPTSSIMRDRRPAGDLRCFAASLPADQHHAAALRRLVTENLRSWQLHHVTHDATLLTHELFTNAVEHGSSSPDDQVTVELRHAGQQVYVAVTDHAPDRLPLPNAAGPEDERGRGMEIVVSLAEQWDVARHHATKTVWAILSAQPPSTQ